MEQECKCLVGVRQRLAFGEGNRASQKEGLAGVGQWEEIGS